jgi:hypothetical protein
MIEVNVPIEWFRDGEAVRTLSRVTVDKNGVVVAIEFSSHRMLPDPED